MTQLPRDCFTTLALMSTTRVIQQNPTIYRPADASLQENGCHLYRYVAMVMLCLIPEGLIGRAQLLSDSVLRVRVQQWRIYIVKFWMRGPPWGPNSFNFMHFFGKFGKIVCWHPPWRVGTRTSGKSSIHHLRVVENPLWVIKNPLRICTSGTNMH